MLAELTQIEAGWPLAASLAVAVTAQSLVAGRRRTALNEALHELRRPLQALVLAEPERATDIGLSEQAALALERLDREINGGPAPDCRQRVEVALLAAAAVRRWQGRAGLAGCKLRLGELNTEATVRGDRGAISQALDNLVVNAIEHGGPQVLVGVAVESPVVRLSVVDSGGSGRTRRRRAAPWRVLVSLSGRRRRGHGLRVVRRVAAAHEGEFLLHPREGETEATLALPSAGDEDAG
ncbi:MAG TPA: ATP-binding protein [Solirubrobacterales bacterium]|nr:ATP-binding protein [Solirubrobacterales bacterium]